MELVVSLGADIHFDDEYVYATLVRRDSFDIVKYAWELGSDLDTKSVILLLRVL